MELLLPIAIFKNLLPLLAIIAGISVISTKNAIISVFNLIVLYILVAFYLIYIGIIYLGISYIIIYIGAIAILFLFIIMMIDIEVVEKRSNNYLPLLFLLLSGFFFTLKKILYNIGLIKMKSISYKEELIFIDKRNEKLFGSMDYNSFVKENINNSFIFSKKNKSYSFYKEISKNNNNEKKIEKEINKNNIFVNYESDRLMNNNYSVKKIVSIDSINPSLNHSIEEVTNYLLIIPNWDSAVNRITQITAVGDILYTVYHSYIYILSIILLLGMIGAIILTAENYEEVKIINTLKNKKSNIFSYYIIINIWSRCFFYYNCIRYNSNFRLIDIINYKSMKKRINCFNFNMITKKSIVIPSFFHTFRDDYIHSEDMLGNLMYFIVANLIIVILLLSVNSYFSLSVKYLEKGGGFECGFTSFVQTRERFNVIFYRVSLLFLIFDLEIILAFPYTAVYQKDQNISKNNVLAFIYILIVGFIFELKEGALNIVKKVHSTEINIKY
jgi:NADH:ubiquinone oxidoreductase subunit 6 (subunit J)/NADH:ubiquinone oxidoreductase subunit 3 (subunit A)